jgi:hypothetical protein
VNVFEGWDFLAAVRKSQASILRVNEQLLELEARNSNSQKPSFEHLCSFRAPLQERHLYRAMLKAQEEARQLLHSNPLVTSFVGQLLKHTTASLQVKWGKIKLGLTYVLSPALPVTGRQLKDTIIPGGIRRRYEQHPDEGKHSDGSAWHVVHQGVTFVVLISKGIANKFLPAANKRQKTSQSQASEHLAMQVGVNAVLTTAAESVDMHVQ